MQSFNTDLPGSLQPSPQPGSQCPPMPNWEILAKGSTVQTRLGDEQEEGYISGLI